MYVFCFHIISLSLMYYSPSLVPDWHFMLPILVGIHRHFSSPTPCWVVKCWGCRNEWGQRAHVPCRRYKQLCVFKCDRWFCRKMFMSNSGLYPLDASDISSSIMTIKIISRCCQMSSAGSKLPQVGSHWIKWSWNKYPHCIIPSHAPQNAESPEAGVLDSNLGSVR